jgi:predicted O-methyltransferase YrrM
MSSAVTPLTRVLKTAGKVSRRLERPFRLYALWRSEDPYVQLLAASAQTALTGALTAEERAIVERIEALRAELAQSKRTLTRPDYGAGVRAGEAPTHANGNGGELADEVQRIARFSSKGSFWALLLFRIVRNFRPSSCIEMGTALGLSGAYQAAALRLNGRGSLISLEGSAELAQIAAENWQRLGLGGPGGTIDVVVGRFSDTLAARAKALAPVDYVFVDGHHDEAATLAYLETLLPHLASPALLVFDDITWSDGMRKAWRAIASDPRIKVAVDFGPMGVCVVGNMPKKPPRIAPLA